MNTQVGALPKDAKLTKMYGEYNETPYFIPGMEENGEHTLAFPKNAVLAGILTGIRTTKAELEKDRRDYLTMVDFSGNKFRVGAPGQLAGLARRLLDEAQSSGRQPAIAITYMGKEFVKSLNTECHQFDVQFVERPQ